MRSSFDTHVDGHRVVLVPNDDGGADKRAIEAASELREALHIISLGSEDEWAIEIAEQALSLLTKS